MDNMINTSENNESNLKNIMVCKFLDEMRSMNLGTNLVNKGVALEMNSESNPYDHIVSMIRELDLNDDGIIMNRKVKAIETDFCNIVQDEFMLCESMNYINAKALDDGEIALKFALLFSSRNFDALAMKETKVRSAMLKILETNFLNADSFRTYDKGKLYNSITLLGEYYHRVRLADNSPITILGESLIGLLVREMEENQEKIDWKLAKLVLSQMTLNGNIMRTRHQSEITQLLYHIRRNLVEQELSPTTKAFLLMTLDLYYSNFSNLGVELETFYTKYLVHQAHDEGNNNHHWQQEKLEENLEPDSDPDLKLDFSDAQPKKKWSEQVCEESLYENEYVQDHPSYDDHQKAASNRLHNNSLDQTSLSNQEGELKNIRRMPRVLKKNIANDKGKGHERLSFNLSPKQNDEEDNQKKPMPRWRAARFNRDEEPNNEYIRNRFKRTSENVDDDHQSVHSEGGIRLYSVKDRQRHSQEKMDRSNHYNFIVNSNWDRQSQRDDRSERSYISNYEYGNGKNQKRSYRNYSNRQGYDKPPRFQKNRKQQQQQLQLPSKENKNYGDNWRRERTTSNDSLSNQDEVRFATLPRPAKTNIKSTSFRRSQSPTHQQQDHKGNYKDYSSQNSVYSEEAVGVENCNQTQMRHYNPSGRRFNPHGRRQRNRQHTPGVTIDNWKPLDSVPVEGCPENDSELVRNARQTTKYMNYLSAKK